MFGVIICPRCHRARGVSLSSKKVRCSHCGRRIDVSLAKVYHRTDDQEELVLAVQRMTEKLAVSVEDYPAERRRRARSPPPAKALKGPSSEEELQALALRLTEERGEFGLADIMAEAGVDQEGAEGVLGRLVAAGLVFEPSPGRFKGLRG